MKLHYPSRATCSHLFFAMFSLYLETQAMVTDWPALSKSVGAVKDLSTSSGLAAKDLSTSSGLAGKASLKDAEPIRNDWLKPLTSQASVGQEENTGSKIQVAHRETPLEGIPAVADGTKRSQASNRLDSSIDHNIDINPGKGTGVFHPSPELVGQKVVAAKAGRVEQVGLQSTAPEKQPNPWEGVYHLISPQYKYGAAFEDWVTGRHYWLDPESQLLALNKKPHVRLDYATQQSEWWFPQHGNPDGTGIFRPPLKPVSEAPLSQIPEDSFSYGGHILPIDPFGLGSIESPLHATTPPSGKSLEEISSKAHNDPGRFQNQHSVSG